MLFWQFFGINKPLLIHFFVIICHLVDVFWSKISHSVLQVGMGGGQRGDPPLETPHPLKNAFDYHLKTPSSYNPPSKFDGILNTPSPWNLVPCPPVFEISYFPHSRDKNCEWLVLAEMNDALDQRGAVRHRVGAKYHEFQLKVSRTRFT